MIEEVADKSRHIERNELVDGARRQALRGEVTRMPSDPLLKGR